MAYILIVDGNLVARKMFYKFSKLVSKIDIEDIKIISNSLYEKISSEASDSDKKAKKKEIVNKSTGEIIGIIEGRINKKLSEILNSTKTIKTGISYGILRSLIAINKQYEIEKTIFCYDPIIRNREAQVRKQIDQNYKISRTNSLIKRADEEAEFVNQLKLAQTILYNMGIMQAWTTKYEADDILHYFACRKYKNKKCIVLTSDHDIYQIIDDKNSLLTIGEKGDLFTKKKFMKNFNIEPSRYLDVMALCGCKGDDVKGLHGIGEGTALKLIQEFLSLELLFRNFRTVNSPTLTKKIRSILEKEEQNEHRNVIKTKKLVKLYGKTKEFKNDLILQQKKKTNPESVLKALELLRFKSLLGEKEKKEILKIIEQKPQEKNRKEKVNI